MKILITGATGYIGSNLIKRLLNTQNEIYTIVRPSSKLNFINEIINKIDIFEYDKNIKNLTNYFNEINPDIVIHLASLFISEHKTENIDDLIESNITFGTHILEAMLKSGVKKIINTGTSWQHYNNEEYNPVCLYASTKEAFEKILEYYVESENFNAITLKLFDTYGPNDKRNKIINLLNKIAKTGETLDMSAGEQYLDLVYIDDVVEAYMKVIELIEKGNIKHKKYFVSSAKQISLKELVNLFEKINNIKLNINWGKRVYRKREVMKLYDKGDLVPDWKSDISIEKGLEKICKFSRGGGDFRLVFYFKYYLLYTN